MLLYLIIILVIITIICVFCSNKKYKKNKKKRPLPIKFVTSRKSSYYMYLKYIHQIDNEDVYLTWRYHGLDLLGNHTYILVLLPYKNKQNEFALHTNDTSYLK